DVEDAFQATFLALAQKAGVIARREAVAAWLYKVAYRVALRASAQARKRAEHERLAVDLIEAAPGDGPITRDLRRVLDEEVNRLPARQRAVFVLCCLEGNTAEQAARQLGCPRGTVS